MAIWKIDPDHSAASFAVRHMTIAYVRGMFSRLRGTVRFDPPDMASASVTAAIEVASVYTGIRKRDDHLRSSEILDAEKYPLITFESRAVVPSGADRARVKGELTLHGVTRSIEFEAGFRGPVKSLFGGEITIGFEGKLKLDREDFGVNWGSDPLESGGLMTGREIEISLDIEADRED